MCSCSRSGIWLRKHVTCSLLRVAHCRGVQVVDSSVSTPTFSYPRGLVAADFDSDGFADLALGTRP